MSAFTLICDVDLRTNRVVVAAAAAVDGFWLAEGEAVVRVYRKRKSNKKRHVKRASLCCLLSSLEASTTKA